MSKRKKYEYIVVASARTKAQPGLSRRLGPIPAPDHRKALCGGSPNTPLGSRTNGRYFLTLAEAREKCYVLRDQHPHRRYKVFKVERVL